MASQPTASGIVEYVAAVVTADLQPLIDDAAGVLTDITDARDAAVVVVGAAGDAAILEIQTEGADQVALATEQADRAEAAADEVSASSRNLIVTAPEGIDGSQLWTEQALNGATASGRTVSIGSGVTGALSLQAAYTAPAPEMLAMARGRTIRMRGVWLVTANFLTDKPLSTTSFLGTVLRGGVATNLTGSNATHVATSQTGLFLTREVDFVVGATDTAWGPGIQIVSGAVANNAHTFRLVSTTWEIVALAGRAESGSGRMLQGRIDALTHGYAATTDEKLNGTQVWSETTAGGSTVTNRTFTIGSGVTGGGSFQAAYTAPTPEELAAAIGQRVRMTGVWEVTAGFLTDKPLFTGTGLGVVLRGGSATTLGSSTARHISTEQSGTLLTRVIEFIVGATDTAWGPGLQIDTAAVANNAHTFGLISVTWEFVTAANSAKSGAALMVEARVPTLTLPSLSGTGAGLIDLLTSASSFANGGSRIDDEDGKIIGMSIASGATGQNSVLYGQIALNGSGRAGDRVRMDYKLAVSGTFTRTFFIALQAQNGVATWTNRQTVCFTTPSAGLRRALFDYTLQGDEIGLRFALVQTSTVNTASVETIELVDMVQTWTNIVSDPLITRAEQNRRDAEKRTLDAIPTILRPLFNDRTITVKPSGGDFTTLVAAMAAVQNSSPSQQWKIAWWAGADWGGAAGQQPNVPAWTSIICQDPQDDAVISFANATDASASNISNTSLFYVRENGIVFEGGTWEIENGRYVFHPDTNGIGRDTVQRFIGVKATHKGNATAVNNTWNEGSQLAFGCGNSGGQLQAWEDCVARGPGGGISVHSPNDGRAWSTPFLIDIDGCICEGTGASFWRGINLANIAVGPGRARIRNTRSDGVSYTDDQWIGGNPGTGVNTAQMAVSIANSRALDGTTALAFTNRIAFGAASGAAYTPLITGA